MPGIVDGGFKFLKSLATFTPGMAKRSAPGPFTAAPIVQGDGNNAYGLTDDVLSLARGSQIAGNWYARCDPYQGAFVMWMTPEFAYDLYSGAGDAYIWYINSNYYLAYEYDNDRYNLTIGGQSMTASSNIAAGTTYNLVARWDTNNTIDGTNYASLSINDSHTFGISTQPTVSAADSLIYIGTNGTTGAGSIIPEGSTIYRRVLFDGTYGVDVGAGDELAAIYNGGVGKDPTLVTGSWDVVFCMPTNSSVGALVSGEGEAWSHPHSSAVLGETFLTDGNTPGTHLSFDGVNDYVNCGSDASLADLAASGDFTVDAWFLSSSINTTKVLIRKSDGATGGWQIYQLGSGKLGAYFWTSGGGLYFPTSAQMNDGIWHHVVLFHDASEQKIRLAIDGIWMSYSSVYPGTPSADAAYDLQFSISSAQSWEGKMAWVRISNNDRFGGAAGTNFVPPAIDAPPATDANTIEQWNLNDGSGTTAAAEVSSPTNDGTINGATWVSDWKSEGSPITPKSVAFDGVGYINCGSAASLDDLALSGDFSVDFWAKVDSIAATDAFIIKGGPYGAGNTGWSLIRTSSPTINFTVYYDTTSAVRNVSFSSAGVSLGSWIHVAGFYDASANKTSIAVNGKWLNTAGTDGVGSPVSDAGYDLYISRRCDGAYWQLNGAMAWLRISNNDRFGGAAGTNFTPPSRTNPPLDDANTISLWRMEEGAGSTVADSNANGNDGTIYNGSWLATKDMAQDAPGSRIYNWGQVFGADVNDEGMTQTLTGLTAGQAYVSRIVAHTDAASGSNDHITLQVWDETNGAEITSFDFGADSSAATPAIAIITWELPTVARNGVGADCTSMSVRILANTAGATVYVHQAEVQENLVDNPSMETGSGDPWVPDGWSNSGLDAGDIEQEMSVVHSGISSLQGNAGATDGEEIRYLASFGSVGSFLMFGGWVYGDGSVSPKLQPFSADRGTYQYSSTEWAFGFLPATAWQHSSRVYLQKNISFLPSIEYSGIVGQVYVDDVYIVPLDPVSLTVTPASEASSLEGNGIRVDGRDTLTQPIPAGKLKATSGEIRFNWTPRHDAADALKFKELTTDAAVIGIFRKDSNNWIQLSWSAANQLKLWIATTATGQTTGTYDATGQIVSGTTYAVKISYDSADCKLYIDNVLKKTISPVGGIDFAANVPDVAHFGTNHQPLYHDDAVFS